MSTQTKAQHTPGPWRVEVNTSLPYLPNTTKIQPVYKIERSNDRTIWFEEEEAKANARLIEAAPAMGKKLVELYEWLDIGPSASNFTPTQKRAVIEAAEIRTLLEKAGLL